MLQEASTLHDVFQASEATSLRRFVFFILGLFRQGLSACAAWDDELTTVSRSVNTSMERLTSTVNTHFCLWRSSYRTGWRIVRTTERMSGVELVGLMVVVVVSQAWWTRASLSQWSYASKRLEALWSFWVATVTATTRTGVSIFVVL